MRLENPAHGGSVVAHADGRTLLVDYGLPGEVVRAETLGRRRGVTFARTLEVVEPSTQRVAAPCPYFGTCGGCQWQHASYREQLAIKRSVVEQIWTRAGLRLPAESAVVGMESPWRYRVRGEFEAVGEGAGFAFGFHRLRSHSVLPVDECPIHDERIERTMRAFRDALAAGGVTGVQNLLLTVEPNGRGVLWRLRLRDQSDAGKLAAVAERAANDVPDLVLLDESMSFDFWGLTFRVRSDTFIQTNYRQMLELYRVVLDDVGPVNQRSLLDLYCGIGTISLPVAQRARSVTGIEMNRNAVNLAQLAARINGVANVKFITAPVESALTRARIGDYDAAILDPPRAGCEPAALAQLLRLGLDRLVYVSCEPSTHARDIAALVRGGYRVRRVTLVDMFPQTYHVESVALLER